MKPGCFLKSIIILTILIAAILYIVQHKSDLFFEPGKKIVVSAFLDDWDNNFNYVKNTPEKSELKNTLKDFIDSLKIKDIPNDSEINRIAGMVKSAAADSIISRRELMEISEKLKNKK
jgi:hypothetical protein